MKTQLMLVPAATLLVTCVHLLAQPQPGTVLWTYAANATISSSPALAADGTIYVAAGVLCAVTNSGSTASNKWTFPAGVSGSAAVGADGTIYFVGDGGTLYALNPDGSSRWTYPGSAGGSPAIASDGTIYFQAYAGLFAIAPSGALKWKGYPGDAGHYSSPIVAADGTVYVGSYDLHQLFALNPDGTQKWSGNLYSVPGDSAAIGADGTSYVSAGPFYAFSPNGTNLWSTIYNAFDGCPVLGQDGTIYVASARSLAAIALSGQFKSFLIQGPSALVGNTTAAIDVGGVVYFCTSNSIWALDASGRVRWTVTQPGDPGPSGDFAITSPIIGPDGTLYAALGNTLYAIATGTNGPANSPWPMYRQNARHTGKVEKPVLKQPQKRSDANFEFQLYPQQLGLTYTVESSSNLYNWTSMTSFVANTLPTDVVDLTASNAPARVYRAFSGP
jgi:outer membrane protein assembly factor BamB